MIWLLGSSDKKKVLRKNLDRVRVRQICGDIVELLPVSKQHASLATASTLMLGVMKCHLLQVQFLAKDIQQDRRHRQKMYLTSIDLPMQVTEEVRKLIVDIENASPVSPTNMKMKRMLEMADKITLKELTPFHDYYEDQGFGQLNFNENDDLSILLEDGGLFPVLDEKAVGYEDQNQNLLDQPNADEITAMEVDLDDRELLPPISDHDQLDVEVRSFTMETEQCLTLPVVDPSQVDPAEVRDVEAQQQQQIDTPQPQEEPPKKRRKKNPVVERAPNVRRRKLRIDPITNLSDEQMRHNRNSFSDLLVERVLPSAQKKPFDFLLHPCRESRSGILASDFVSITSSIVCAAEEPSSNVELSEVRDGSALNDFHIVESSQHLQHQTEIERSLQESDLRHEEADHQDFGDLNLGCQALEIPNFAEAAFDKPDHDDHEQLSPSLSRATISEVNTRLLAIVNANSPYETCFVDAIQEEGPISRRQASWAFYALLVMEAEKKVSSDQTEFWGPIHIVSI